MKPSVEIDAFAYLGVALLLLVLPVTWVAAAITAAAIHEIGHVAAVFLTGNRILHLRIGCRGAEITAEPMTSRQQILCSLAGPAASLLLVLLCHHFPAVAVCGLIQGIYNLLPVYPLDGGQVLQSLLLLFLQEEKVRSLCRFVHIIVWILLAFLGFLACFALQDGSLLLFPGLSFLYIKYSCKETAHAVQ